MSQKTVGRPVGEERRSPGAGPMSVEEVERELGRLRMNDDGSVGLRSSVLNLIVVTGEENAASVTRAISELADRYPSRVIVLISDPEGEERLDIGLSAFCSLRGGANQSVCSEQITVHAEGPPAGHLESIAGPLLIPDLPTYLFYPGEFSAASPEFARMSALADHLIVDSSGACERTFREVAALLEDRGMPPVGDLQWAALSSWRALARDLFGSPERAAEAGKIRSVEVLYAPDGECRALLFVGWICAAFGWEPRRRLGPESEREFVLEGPSGEVRVKLAPAPEKSGAPLSRITLRSGGYEFEISRPKDRHEVRVSVRRGQKAVGESAARLGSFDTSATLGEELKRRTRDRAYEAALKRAVEVLSL